MLAGTHAKTAHGLLRGPSRYRIVGVVDASLAGRDAGDVLDGQHRDIPVVASVQELLALVPEKPDYCVIGVATKGGVLTDSLFDQLMVAAQTGISLVNGLHERLTDRPELAALAQVKGLELVDLRQPRPAKELSFWTGDILSLETPRLAVLGTDCALGKRTTSQLLCDTLRQRGLKAEMVFTGQTGWLQGAPHGFIFDATPNDFVSGELERAILDCARDQSPDLIVLEGQSGLRNPTGPCGAEFLLSGAATGVVLQHAPGRRYFTGLESLSYELPSIASEIELIRAYGCPVWALSLYEEGLSLAELEEQARQLEQELNVPVVLPLRGGMEPLAEVVASHLVTR
jgi:uncharacterized NAD-dependent epimerase/dehydratase family protein